MSFRVRLYRVPDVPGVVRAVREVYDEYGFSWDPDGYHYDLYHLDESYGNPRHAFYVAEAERGEIMGCVGLGLHALFRGDVGELIRGDSGLPRLGGTDCSLLRLYVRPSARRQGVGTALLKAVLADAGNRQRKVMEIWSDKRFEDAHRLYQRLGARSVSERICDDPDRSPEWGLVLPVPQSKKMAAG